MPEEQDSGTLERAIAEVASVEASIGLSQKVLVISEDSLELSVRDGIGKIRKQDAWLAPLGVFVSCLIGSLTSDFKDRFYVPKEFWKTLFFAGTLASGVWLTKVLIQLEKFDHKAFMIVIKNKCSKQRIASSASNAVTTLTNDEIPIKLEIQCSQCGSAIPYSANSKGPRVCPNCNATN